MMLIDYIHNSSLVDFQARMSVGNVLAHIASLHSLSEQYSKSLVFKVCL